ncbi:hypothetical protein TSPI_10553 [Trichinella spiralis]|uniref:Uncharacterized protein n=1 Tax=Trichinella spiralis TaxID=6334 RepID=A0ABR3KQW0_TRISP
MPDVAGDFVDQVTIVHAGARPDRWSIRRPMVRLTRCWAWRRVDRRRASRGRVNLRCLLFDPACQCHSSSSRHSHADPPADLPPTASCRRAFQQYLVKQNRSKQTTQEGIFHRCCCFISSTVNCNQVGNWRKDNQQKIHP